MPEKNTSINIGENALLASITVVAEQSAMGKYTCWNGVKTKIVKTINNYWRK